MKFLKWAASILLFLIIVVFIGVFLFVQNQKPDYDEALSWSSVDTQVDVYYDSYGIPHIYADNNKDAYMALGYVHAKDRLWQMELLRRIIPGRLAEMFGERSLKTDQFFRSLDQKTASKNAVVRFKKECPTHIQEKIYAYIEGVNKYIEDGPTPIEYTLLGVEKSPYTIEDMYNVMAYMAFSFAVAHRVEPTLSKLLKERGTAYLEDLDIQIDTTRTLIEGYDATQLDGLSLHISEILEGLPVPQLIGSNSWVVAPTKTKTNGVIFANDPHMRYGSPSVWYEAQMEIGDVNVYGNYIAGFPIPLIGNTAHHAIGMTMFANDDTDFYLEKINPADSSQYWHIDQWKQIETRDEIIKVKGGEDYKIKLERTVHGPIISKYAREMSKDDPISIFWIYDQFPNQVIEASHKLIFSKSLEEAQEGASMIVAPGINIMYGDVDDNIAWWASAKLPVRNPKINPKFILDGSTGNDDITEYYDFSENPQAVNPPSGFVYSANNQSISAGENAPWGYYQPEDRARRISYLLEKEDQWDTQKVREMILDITSMNDVEVKKDLISYLDEEDFNSHAAEGLDILKSWEGKHGLEDIAPTIYYKWLYHVLVGMMSDEVDGNIKAFINLNPIKRSHPKLIANENAIWWDDIRTDKKETAPEIVKTAYEKTMAELEAQLVEGIEDWKWSKVHTLEHEHSLGANETLRPYFNVGPFPVDGGRGVINNYNFSLSGDGTYETSSGPSCRRVINMKDLKKDNWSILPTGQSGNRWSPHYRDQADMFVQGKFRRQLIDREDIIEEAVSHTIISPE